MFFLLLTFLSPYPSNVLIIFFPIILR